MSESTRLPERFLDLLSVAIVESGRPQVLIARDTGLSEKHVSQMLTGKADGSLRSWQAMLDSARLEVHVTVHPLHIDVTDESDETGVR